MMNFQTGDFIAVHQNPIWRGETDIILRALVASEGGKNEWEQLWGKKTTNNQEIVCCIPFFLYDVSLGDEISYDETFYFIKAVKRSQNYTFRVWFEVENFDVRREFLDKLKAHEILIEWYSKSLFSLNVSKPYAQTVADFLMENERAGLIVYEAGMM